MAGSLIKINEAIVTSATPSVTLTGIDSTYDVYMVRYNNVRPTTDDKDLFCRVTVGGTADSSAEYDYAYKQLRADTTFQNTSYTNQTSWRLEFAIGNIAGQEMANAVMYLFNFNNASEYSFMTLEGSNRLQGQNLLAETGGGVQTESQACDGLEFFWEASSTFAEGQFVLYGLKK